MIEKPPAIYVEGHDAAHRVENVVFENIVSYDERITDKSSLFTIDSKTTSEIVVR